MAEIDLTPTEEMAANAARGLELRRKHGKGGTAIGVARARDISNRKNLSPETVRRMHAFFSRHEKNKAGGEDDAGYIAWLLWGGDSGRSWAKRKVEQMDKGENQRSDTYKEIAQRLGSAAKHDRPGEKARFGMTNAGYKALVDAIRVYGESAPAAVVAQAKQMKQEPTEFTDNEVMAVIAKIKQARASRPGAKARMSKDWQTIERYLEVLDTEFGEPRGKAAAQEMMRAAAAIGGDEGARLKAAINTMATSRDYNARQRAYNAIASMMPFSRPGAKAKFAKRYDAKIVGNELVRSDGRRYRITGRKPSLPNAREMLGEVEWLMMVGENGSEYSVQRFDDGGYRVFGGAGGMRVQWDGLVRASRPGAKAKMGRAEQVMRDGSVHLDFTAAKEWLSAAKDAELRYIVADSKSALNANPDGKKFNYYRDLVLEAMKELKKRGFSRPGAKAKMAANEVDLWNYLSKSDVVLARQNATDLATLKRYAQMALTKPDFTPPSRAQHGPSLHAMAKDTLADIRAWEESVQRHRNRMSRPGAKAKMGANEDRKRAAGYKWQVRYTKQLGKTDYLGGSPQVIEDTVYFATESNARDWANTMLGKGWFKGMGGSPEKVLTAKVLMFSRFGAKAKMATEGRVKVDGVEYRVLPYQVEYFKSDLAKFDDPKWRKQVVQQYLAKNYIVRASRPGAKVANAVREGEKVSAADDAVSRKIRKLMDEGKPQKQAVAIALDLERRGEL